MTKDRSDPLELSDETLRALVRAYGSAPPYASVNWESLAQRVTQDAQTELERRQLLVAGARPWAVSSEEKTLTSPSLHIDDGGRSRRRVSGRVKWRWWEVTAGWVRPAMIAASVVIAVAASLTVALPNVPSSVTGDSSQPTASEYATQDRDAGDSAMEAAVVGRTSGQQYDPQLDPATRDQIFTEVVDER